MTTAWEKFLYGGGNMRLRYTDKGFVLEQHKDWYRNSMPFWIDLNPPKEIIEKLVKESTRYPDYFDSDEGLKLSSDLVVLYRKLKKEWDEKEHNHRIDSFKDARSKL